MLISIGEHKKYFSNTGQKNYFRVFKDILHLLPFSKNNLPRPVCGHMYENQVFARKKSKEKLLCTCVLFLKGNVYLQLLRYNDDFTAMHKEMYTEEHYGSLFKQPTTIDTFGCAVAILGRKQIQKD